MHVQSDPLFNALSELDSTSTTAAPNQPSTSQQSVSHVLPEAILA